MFNDTLSDEKEYRWASDNPLVKRAILEFDHKSNSELLDMYFLWRKNYEDAKNEKWSKLLEEDIKLIEEEIFNR